jgi:hypothetical protein
MVPTGLTGAGKHGSAPITGDNFLAFGEFGRWTAASINAMFLFAAKVLLMVVSPIGSCCL